MVKVRERGSGKRKRATREDTYREGRGTEGVLKPDHAYGVCVLGSVNGKIFFLLCLPV